MTDVSVLTTTPAPAGTLPTPLRLGVARAAVEVKAFAREKDAVIFVFAFPVIMLAIFSTVFGGDDGAVLGSGSDPGVPFAQYFLPGMLAAGVMLSSFQSLAISIAVERDDGTLKRLRGTPLPAVSYFLGKVGQVLVTSVVQAVVLIVFAVVAFGVALPDDLSRWLTFVWVFVLGSAAGTVLGVAFSSVPRSGRSASAVVTPVVVVLQFISGVFFILNDLPPWLRHVAEVFPLKWLAQGMRSVFLEPRYEAVEVSGSWQHGPTALVLLGWLVVGFVLCVRTFRWSRRDDG